MEENHHGKIYGGDHVHQLTRELCEGYAEVTDDDNPRYRGAGAVAPPMVLVTASIPFGVGRPVVDPQVVGDEDVLLRLLHGEEDIRWHRPMHQGDALTTTATVAGMQKKRSGDLLSVATQIKNQRGELVADTTSHLFIRAEHGGATMLPKGEPAPEVEAESSVRWVLKPDQNLRYAKYSGDDNLIHTDEDYARRAGLPGCVLHGLCSLAFAARSIIDEVLGGDPAGLVRLRGRFSSPVFMGDTLECRIWRDGPPEGDHRPLGFHVVNQHNHLIVKGGAAWVRLT